MEWKSKNIFIISIIGLVLVMAIFVIFKSGFIQVSSEPLFTFADAPVHLDVDYSTSLIEEWELLFKNTEPDLHHCTVRLNHAYVAPIENIDDEEHDTWDKRKRNSPTLHANEKMIIWDNHDDSHVDEFINDKGEQYPFQQIPDIVELLCDEFEHKWDIRSIR